MLVMSRTGVVVAVLASFLGACNSGGNSVPGGNTSVSGDGGPSGVDSGATDATATVSADATVDAPGDASADSPAVVALNPQRELGDAADPDACVAAGGQCVKGVDYCANVGPGATPGSCQDIEHPSVLCCAVNEDAGCTEIQASNYDQHCNRESDCIRVNVGNPCAICVFQCFANVGAINVGAASQYMADVSRTPEAFGGVCNCPQLLPGNGDVCCVSGQCLAGSECISLGDAATDAGAE
jgi:hypothetical protein